MDQGKGGLNSTINILDKNNLLFIGIGNNLSEASRPYILKEEGIKIGFYACAEHEFSIINRINPGANLFDPLESLDHIMELKKTV